MSATVPQIALAVTGSVLGAGAIAGGVYLAIEYARAGTVRHVLRRSPAMVDGRYTEAALARLVRDRYEIRFLDTRGVPPHVNGTTIRVASIPSTARRLPLVAPTSTPLVPAGYNRLTRDRRKWFGAVRGLLAAAGASDLDERVIGYRWAVETFWDRSCQQRNRGNVKSQGYGVFCESWDTLVREQRVWLDKIPEATGVYGIVDRASSADFYPAFSSDADYVAFFRRVLDRFRATDAARRGGLVGAQEFERALARGGYSPSSESAAVAEVSGYWRRSSELIGAAKWEARQWD